MWIKSTILYTLQVQCVNYSTELSSHLKNHTSSSKEEQNRFKKTQKGQLKNTATLDVPLLCRDESTNKIAPNIKRK